jgi:hypothetical protein
MPLYHLAGTIEVWDSEWSWYGKRATRGEVVSFVATVDAPTPRQALGLAAQEMRHSWPYWEPHNVIVRDDEGREVLRDNRLATFQERHGDIAPWLLLAER